MKNKSATSAYEKSSLEAKVMGETPHGLVRILLEKLCEKLTLAYDGYVVFENNPGQELNPSMTKYLLDASKIIGILNSSLIKDHDEELFNHLNHLHRYIQYHIVLTVQNQKSLHVKNALEMAQELLSMWTAIPEDFHRISAA
jgi:flagellin-specific chaperone FliS